MDILIVILQILFLIAIVMTPTLERILPLPAHFEFPDIVHCLSLLGIAWCAVLIIMGAFRLGKFARIMPKPVKRAELQTTGAYAFSRHPMYSGMIGASFFWSLYLASPFALFCWVFFFFILLFKVQREETYLLKLFGQEYKAYSKKVGMFFPKKF